MTQTKPNEVFCKEHPFSGARFVPAPHQPGYGKMVCPKCSDFLGWAKKPEGSAKRGNAFTLGGKEFSTKTELTEYIKSVLAGLPLNTPLDGDPYEIISSLFELHPDAETKIGPGIGHIEIRINKEFSKISRGFWIVRADGTETDISYKKCLEGESAYRNQFIRACRVTIKPHIEHFRREFFRVALAPTCCLTGEPLSRETCHVDHAPPYTFERIVDAFAALNGLDPNAPGLCVSGIDGWLLPSLADDILRDKFVQFHNTFAQLRVISAPANMVIVPKSVKRGNHDVQVGLFENGSIRQNSAR